MNSSSQTAQSGSIDVRNAMVNEELYEALLRLIEYFEQRHIANDSYIEACRVIGRMPICQG